MATRMSTRKRTSTTNFDVNHDVVVTEKIVTRMKQNTPKKALDSSLVEIKETPEKKRKQTSSKSALNCNKNNTSQPKSIEVEDEDSRGLSDVDSDTQLFYGYESEIAYMKSMVDNLFKHSQASSLIVCGDCGVGKSTLVEVCFTLYPVLGDKPDPHYGHLNVALFRFDGNLQGKNDLATLRLIGKKLNSFLGSNRQVAVDGDDVDDFLVDYDSDEEIECLSRKVDNSIPKIMAQFRFLTEHCPNFRSIIVLDNFEVFCRKQQTLLYNLLDLTQHGRSVLVIGITRRLDCIELFEKRVRSRLTQRVIHLITPFKTVDTYRQFCQLQAKHMRCSRERSCWDNIQLEMVKFENEIVKSFSINRSFDDIKRIIQQYSFVPDIRRLQQHGTTTEKSDDNNSNDPGSSSVKPPIADSSVFLHKDPKIVNLSNLTKNELVLLVVATRQLRHQQTETFTCKQLYEWGSRVQQLKLMRFNVVTKSIYKMIELDLMIVASESGHSRAQCTKDGQLWITPWTTLVLNISEFQINTLLEGLGNKVPSYIKQLFI